MKRVAKGVSRSDNNSSGQTLEFPALYGDLETDVVVIGGGIAGLSVAYALARDGRQCVVLERNAIPANAPCVNNTHLTDALDGRYFQLQKLYGAENARLAAESHTTAINATKKIIDDEKIDCDFIRLDGYLSLHPSDRVKTLRQEFEASRSAGLHTELVSHAPGIKLRERISLKFPAQAQFDRGKYINGLCKAIMKYGGRIFTGTTVLDVDNTGATTATGRVSAKHMIIATNTPSKEMVRVHVKQLAYRSYTIGATIKKGSIAPALWWDTGDQHSVWSTSPYHYARIEPFNEEFDLLVCGGEDHKTDSPEGSDAVEADRFEYLEAWAYDHFPAIRDVVCQWSDRLLEPVDSLGYIGRNPGDSNVYIVSGDAGQGFTYAAIAAILIPDLIAKRKNPWEDLYNPSRTPVQVLSEFLTESTDTKMQYLDFRTPGDEASERALSNDEGAVIRMHGRRIAVYRDSKGDLHAHFASCPRVGCGLRWNNYERTFACACYGSKPSERISMS